MLWNVSDLVKSVIQAKDGEIGSVSDFLFDDQHWTVRWLVVDTGTWLSKRRVLVPASCAKEPRIDGPLISAHLTREQIERSPDIDIDQPVSRQMENRIYSQLGWPPYWMPDPIVAPGTVTGFAGPLAGMRSSWPTATSSIAARHRGVPTHDRAADRPESPEGDSHLRSIREVTGYHISAADGELGHSEAFLVEDEGWLIIYVVVDTKKWWPSKKVLLRTDSISAVDWSARLISVKLTREQIKDLPEYNPAKPPPREEEST